MFLLAKGAYYSIICNLDCNIKSTKLLPVTHLSTSPVLAPMNQLPISTDTSKFVNLRTPLTLGLHSTSGVSDILWQPGWHAMHDPTLSLRTMNFVRFFSCSTPPSKYTLANQLRVMWLTCMHDRILSLLRIFKQSNIGFTSHLMGGRLQTYIHSLV